MNRLVLLLSLLIVAPAHAGSVGIVVTGDSELKAVLETSLDGWLRTHGHSVGNEAMPRDATSSLLNCMVIDDEACARDIVDARAKTESVVFSEIRKPRTKSSNATTITLYWLVRGKEPVGMRRACEACNERLLKSTLDDMLKTVFGASNATRGKLLLHSKPEGASVMLDNENIGITPLERDVPAGEHKIVLIRYGQKVGERNVKISTDAVADITMSAQAAEQPSRPSQVVPAMLLGLGGVTVIGGAVLYLTSETDDGSQPYYRDTRPAGIAMGIGGVILAGVGAYLLVTSGHSESAPVAAIDRNGAIVGWVCAF